MVHPFNIAATQALSFGGRKIVDGARVVTDRSIYSGVASIGKKRQ